MLPWISDDSDSDSDSSVESHKSLHFSDLEVKHLNYSSTFPGLKAMPPDVTVIIFQHLSIQEISSVSQVCKATFAASRDPDLWKIKFCLRWNFRMSGDHVDWFKSYVYAYKNCHDLWLTHWNVVYPCDSLSPGRCCIKRQEEISENDERWKSSNPQELSPFYRFGDPKEECTIPDVVETRAQAIGMATALRLQQYSDLRITQYSTRRAKRAFSKSATLNRRISTQQFDVQSLSFLTDVLFFNVHSHYDELEKLEERFSSSDLQEIDSENCLHSWHSVHFSNPDFNKPMKWRVVVQRPDCFTVYPSEGYLRPGATQIVVFGVTPTASYLVQSKYHVDSKKRDYLDSLYDKVEDSLAQFMPPRPFQVQYQYVTPIPCNMFQNNICSYSHLFQSNLPPKLRSVWDDLSASHLGVRTMYIAAHVHSSFPLYEFRRNALVPFDIQSSCERLHLFCAPRSAHLDASRWKEDLQNITMETENSLRGKTYRTEGPCKKSGVFWGQRFEELANAYVVEKIHCEIQKDRRNEKAKVSGELLRLLINHKNENLFKQSIGSAFSILQKMIIEYRDARWLSRRQMHVFREWKSAICQIGNDMRLGRCPLLCEEIPILVGECNNSKTTKKYLVMKPGDKSVSGPQLAALVLANPRSLESFGAYERINCPGTLCTRSQFAFLPKLNISDVRMPKMKIRALFCSLQELAYYRSRNSLDMEALCYVDSFCRQNADNHCLNVSSQLPLLGRTDAPDPDEISVKRSEIQEYIHASSSHPATSAETRVGEEAPLDNVDFPDLELRAQRNGAPRRIPRLLRFFVFLSTRLGLFAASQTNVSQCFIGRRLLISIHWISISLMVLPLFSTLLARYIMMIPSTPVDYSLEGLPFSAENKLRYLSEQECGYAALSVVTVWLVLGRWIERYTARSYLRAMLEHQFAICKSRNCSSINVFQRWIMRLWDSVCPLFLQKLLFLVPWNRRSPSDVARHAAFWRSHTASDYQYTFDASKGHSPVVLTFGDSGMDIGHESNGWKAFLGILVAIGSFWISSPHMGLNALSIGMNGMSFGVSFSLQSMEVGRDELTYRRTGSLLKTINTVSIVLFSCLLGQMVGSSGGILFLAEFIVTSVSLLLGGAGTMSVDTMQSWFTFLFYSTFAAFGFAIGKASIEQGVKKKSRCLSSILLCVSIILAPCSLWLMAIFIPWDFPVPLIIRRPAIGNLSTEQGRVYSAKDLQ